MSTPTEQTPPAAGDAAAPKKSSKMLLIVVAVVVLAAVGGGFVFLRKGEAAPEEKKSSKKASHDEADDEEAADEEASTDDEEPKTEKAEKSEHAEEAKTKPVKLSLPDDSKVKQVVELQPFVVNLADPAAARYLRVTISIGTAEEGEESKPDPLFVTRVRNAMLAVLTTKTSEEVLTIEGKAALRKQLLAAAKKASEEPEVAAVYITEFIVQM